LMTMGTGRIAVGVVDAVDFFDRRSCDVLIVLLLRLGRSSCTTKP
jgi:hypothetical protein